MAQPWFDDPITEPHSSDDGVDIGTPDRTPVWMPFGGTVIDSSYHDYGGQVVVDVPGTGASEYFIHLNDITVQPGEQLAPGELIGDTGGGVGDLVLHNGRVQPAQSQSWYDGHSTGYHTEYGIFEGDDMAAFNEGWGNKSRQLDPTGVLAELRGGGSPQWPGSSPPTPGSPGSPGTTPLGLTNPLDPASWVNGIAHGLGFSSPGNAIQRLAVGGAGIGAIALAAYMVLQPEAEKTLEVAGKVAGTAKGLIP